MLSTMNCLHFFLPELALRKGCNDIQTLRMYTIFTRVDFVRGRVQKSASHVTSFFGQRGWPLRHKPPLQRAFLLPKWELR